MVDRNYCMVRAMESQEQDFDVFFKNNVVAVGWSNVDFTQFTDIKELRNAVYVAYYKEHQRMQTVSKNLNEIERFWNLKKGDYIIVPCGSSIVLAEAEDGELYSEKAYNLDLSNQHKVSYRFFEGELLKIPRNDLSEGLQRRLRVPGNTVTNLVDFKEEIERIFTRTSYSYSQEMQEREQKEYEELKKNLLKNIQDGRTNLQTGGIGLEQLVCELMQCEGYDATVLDKKYFPEKADADIKAIKEDYFMSKKIFAQVKHHKGYSDKTGIQQLIDVLKNPDYKEYDGYFITSALIDRTTRDFAESNGIYVMDGNELVNLIVDNLSKLKEVTKRHLGICTIPHIIEL